MYTRGISREYISIGPTVFKCTPQELVVRILVQDLQYLSVYAVGENIRVLKTR